MKTFIIIAALLFTILAGCGTDTPPGKPHVMSVSRIQTFVDAAIKGDRNSNDSLAGLIDYSLPLNSSYNNIDVQEGLSTSGKKFFTVLIEYPNPIYNRFAIYDSALIPVLIDKSLSGILAQKIISLNNRTYAEVNEVFLTKDILELNRLSLYQLDSSAHLAFRAFTRFVTPQNSYYQTMSELSEYRVRTDLSSTKRSTITSKSDIFSYDFTLNKYLSAQNIFHNFIKDEISKITKSPDLPEIFDEKSALQSIGITKDADTIKSASNIPRGRGFTLTLSEGWKELKDVAITGYKGGNLKGYKYYNPVLGANFYIVKIISTDSAEIHLKYSFLHVHEGKYRVRFTDKIETTKSYIQMFEYSCGDVKFIMIFDGSKYTYEQYKQIYEDIINSFTLDC